MEFEVYNRASLIRRRITELERIKEHLSCPVSLEIKINSDLEVLSEDLYIGLKLESLLDEDEEKYIDKISKLLLKKINMDIENLEKEFSML